MTEILRDLMKERNDRNTSEERKAIIDETIQRANDLAKWFHSKKIGRFDLDTSTGARITFIPDFLRK